MALKAIEQPVDTATAAGTARGVYKGRKPTIDTAGVCRLGIGRASVSRVPCKAGPSPAGVDWAMAIRREPRPLYPPHWKALSRRVRFAPAGGMCERCGRPRERAQQRIICGSRHAAGDLCLASYGRHV